MVIRPRHINLQQVQKPQYQFFCVVRKANTHIGTKALNMRHQTQKGFCGIFVGITQHQKGYFVYVPSSMKIVSTYDVVFDEIFFNALAYISQPYSESMATRPSVTNTSFATSLREQTGDIIKLTQFEEGHILTKTHNHAESGNDDSIIPPLLSKKDMNAMDSGDESDHDVISTEMIEDIHEGRQSHPNVNQREA